MELSKCPHDFTFIYIRIHMIAILLDNLINYSASTPRKPNKTSF